MADSIYCYVFLVLDIKKSGCTTRQAEVTTSDEAHQIVSSYCADLFKMLCTVGHFLRSSLNALLSPAVLIYFRCCTQQAFTSGSKSVLSLFLVGTITCIALSYFVDLFLTLYTVGPHKWQAEVLLSWLLMRLIQSMNEANSQSMSYQFCEQGGGDSVSHPFPSLYNYI